MMHIKIVGLVFLAGIVLTNAETLAPIVATVAADVGTAAPAATAAGNVVTTVAGNVVTTVAPEVATLAADAGTPAADAGTPAADVGTPAADAGTPAADVGTPAADVGTPAADAGTPAADVGTPAADAGTPAADAGTPAADAGTPAAIEQADEMSCYTCSQAKDPFTECMSETEVCTDTEPVCYFKGRKQKNGHILYNKGCMKRGRCETKVSANGEGCAEDMNPDDMAVDDECFVCTEGPLSNAQDQSILPKECYNCDWSEDPEACQETISCENSGHLCSFKTKRASSGKLLYWRGCSWRLTCQNIHSQNADTCPEGDDDYSGLAEGDMCMYCTESDLSNSQLLSEPTTEAPVVTTEAPVVTTEAPVVTTEAPVVTTEAPAITTDTCYACTKKKNFDECATETEACEPDSQCFIKVRSRNNGKLSYNKGCMNAELCNEKMAANPESCAAYDPDILVAGEECYHCSVGDLSNENLPSATTVPPTLPVLADEEEIKTCYSCKQSTNPAVDCLETEQCGNNEDFLCYVKARKRSNGDIYFGKGCMKKQRCRELKRESPEGCKDVFKDPNSIAKREECYKCSRRSLSNKKLPKY